MASSSRFGGRRGAFVVSAFGLLAALAAAVVACEGDTADKPVDDAPLLHALVSSQASPRLSALATQGDELVKATDELMKAPTAANLAAAQQAWRRTRKAYRELDGFHFGPVEDLSIASRIDVSTVDTAGIEAILAGTGPVDKAAVAAAGGTKKGFLGAQSLLFAVEGDEVALARLTAETSGPRRAALLSSMAQEIAESCHQLADAWSSSSATSAAGYASEVTSAGAGSARYPTQRAAVDDVVGGVAYALELVVGVRLAEPLGRRGDGTPQPQLDATRPSDNLGADLAATMAGVKAMYDGGFAERIRQKNPAIDAQASAELAACIEKIDAMPRPFEKTLTSETATVQAAYDACKAFKGTWNTDVTSGLGATLKPSDNDGD
jgi:putative iron-regulated protein